MRPQIISFHCVMKNRLGDVLSSSFNRDVINQRDLEHDRLPGLVEGLQFVEAGEKRTIVVPADKAYGPYDPSLVLELRRSELECGARLAPGSQVHRRLAGNSEDQVFRVTRLDVDLAVLDGNHPLAGQDLIFEVEIVSARVARETDFLAGPLPPGGRLLH